MANREQESDPENSERLAAPLRQLAWEEYAEKTPNLHRKGLRRVEQHVGFDAAWDLLQPLLTDAESRAASATTEVARLQAEHWTEDMMLCVRAIGRPQPAIKCSHGCC